jgi:hypothetical protein
VECKTAENWMRTGRRVKERQEPLKWVKQRAVTLNKRRQQEMARQEGEEVMQGLYAEWQTEVYRPPPIRDVSEVGKGCRELMEFLGYHPAELVWEYRSVCADNVASGRCTSAV